MIFMNNDKITRYIYISKPTEYNILLDLGEMQN